MNDTITTVRSLDSERHHTVTTDIRLTPADRLSVRIGLWLLLRAERRADAAREVDVHARNMASTTARAAHERTAMRAWQCGVRIY